MSDIIIGLQYGDEGKGKVTKALIESVKYTHCVRFNGGPNAGHTIYFKGNKLVTHQVPTGIVYGLTCIIGPCCVIDIDKLEKEITMLEENGVEKVRDNLKIAYNAHIIKPEHIKDDIANDMSGSTHCGIRPVYRDKYDRCGTRAEKYQEDGICGCEVINTYDELSKDEINVMFEGAQGFMLDIDWGYYPYVTSSHCTSSMISSCGFPFKRIGSVYGVAKIYETYVGKMKYQGEDKMLDKLGELGQEFGATTGRKRQCNWLDMDILNRSLAINSVTNLIINKCDILEKLGVYKLYNKKQLVEFATFDEMKAFINENIADKTIKIIYSYHKDRL